MPTREFVPAVGPTHDHQNSRTKEGPISRRAPRWAVRARAPAGDRRGARTGPSPCRGQRAAWLGFEENRTQVGNRLWAVRLLDFETRVDAPQELRPVVRLRGQRSRRHAVLVDPQRSFFRSMPGDGAIERATESVKI